MRSVESEILHWSGSDVNLTQVERQIGQLRKELSRRLDDSAPVATHVFNLVVYTDSRERAEQIALDLAQIGERQPSRAIILITDRWHEDSPLDAEVRLMCSRPSRDRAPLCFEQVFVTVQGRAADHLSSVVIPLLMPELPTYLWWPGQPQFGHRLFHRLLAPADRLVVDSAQFDSPGDGLNELSRLASVDFGLNDFNWARLRPWRDIVAQFFDAPALVPYARSLNFMRVEFGAGEGEYSRGTTGLLLMLGWVASELHMEPETTLDAVATRDVNLSLVQGTRVIYVDVDVRPHGPQSAGRLMRIELKGQPEGKEEGVFEVHRSSDLQYALVEMHIGHEKRVSRVVPLDIRSDVELLADELSTADHNDAYRRAVIMAARVAGRETWLPS